MRKIAVYVDLFDPITDWELDVINKLRTKFDMVLVAPLCSPMMKQMTSSFEDRIDNLTLALEQNDRANIVKSNDPDKGMACTHHIMNGVKGEFPNDELHMVITEHLVETIPHWENINELRSVSKINIVGRQQLKEHVHVVKYEINYIDFEGKYPWEDESPMPSLIRPGQLEHMIDKGMKFNHLLSKILNKAFIEHTLCCVNIAEKLAMKYEPSLIKKARIAALLHDVARALPPAQLKKWLSNKESKEAEALWHAHAGAKIAKNNFFINDKLILDAIDKHTEASKKMTKLDMIVYCADNMDPKKRMITAEIENSGDLDWLSKHIDEFTLTEIFVKCLIGLKNNLIKNGIIQSSESFKIFKKWKV